MGKLLYAQEHIRLAPQPFQVVVQTLLFQEQMHDHIAVVHQHPAALRHAFDGMRQLAIVLLDAGAHIVNQRLKLPVTVAVSDDEEIGDDGVGAQVEEDNIFRFLIFNNLYYMSSEV